MEFEIPSARGADSPGLDKFHVHIGGFAAWEFERLMSRSPCRRRQLDGLGKEGA